MLRKKERVGRKEERERERERELRKEESAGKKNRE